MLTGPLGFGLAGGIDVLAVLVMVLRYGVKARLGRRRQAVRGGADPLGASRAAASSTLR